MQYAGFLQAGDGIQVSLVNPGMVRSEFFDDLDFAPGDAPDNSLQVDDVADAALTMLNAQDNAVIDEQVTNGVAVRMALLYLLTRPHHNG